jgi:hypothetical protein
MPWPRTSTPVAGQAAAGVYLLVLKVIEPRTAFVAASILVEIDTTNFAFKDNDYSANKNYVEVGKNSVKIEDAGDFFYCPAIGDVQQAGVSNTTNSGLYRIPVSGAGVLGAPVKAYQGHTVSSFYDIRDIAVGTNNALILIGRWSSTYGQFPFAIMKIAVSALANLAANTNISTLFSNASSRIEVNTSGIIGYGPYYTVRYEKFYKHFWSGQCNQIKIWDESAIDASTSAPTTATTLQSTAFYDPAGGFINSLDIFTDNADEASAEPQVLRSAVAAVGVGGSQSGFVGSVDIEKAIMRSFLEEAAKAQKK